MNNAPEPEEPTILTIVAILTGKLFGPVERKEILVPNGADADVEIFARIRGGTVELDIIGETTVCRD